MEKRELFEALGKPIPRDLIKVLRGNKYIEGFEAINQANTLFGFDGWGYQVTRIDYREFERPATRDKGPVTVGMYTAWVTVKILDWPERGDVGVGITSGDTPEAHDTAVKGAVTEALKRGLRSAGSQFGNDLYDKLYDPNAAEQPPQRQQQQRQPAPPAENPDAARFAAQDAALGELVTGHGADMGRVMAAITKTMGGEWPGLTLDARAEALRKLQAQPPQFWLRVQPPDGGGAS